MPGNPEKTFVIPTFGVEPSKDLTTLMNPLSLAVARETGQFDSVAQERRSAFVEVLGANSFSTTSGWYKKGREEKSLLT